MCMSANHFSNAQIVTNAQFSTADIALIEKRREPATRLGFAYQLAFVRIMQRFPIREPFEIESRLLTYISLQLNISADVIQAYGLRVQTKTEHRRIIMDYLNLVRFGEQQLLAVELFLFTEAQRIEQSRSLIQRARQFLHQQHILFPSDDTLERIIVTQRQKAREYIYTRIADQLSPEMRGNLDTLITVKENSHTLMNQIKQPAGSPTPKAMLRLINQLEAVRDTGVLSLDLTWINNNYQRSLAQYARHLSAYRIRRLENNRRYAVLVCFLHHHYADLIDFLVEMHGKLMTTVYNRAENKVGKILKQRRKVIQRSLKTFRTIGHLLLDDDIINIRQSIFKHINRDQLTQQVAVVDTWLEDQQNTPFRQVTQRYSYLRQFAPALLTAIELEPEADTDTALIKAIDTLNDLNQTNKRKLPDDIPVGFIPKKLVPFVINSDSSINRRDWECALLTAVRDEIRNGNVAVKSSKRFGHFEHFFTTQHWWDNQRETFFQRAGLPSDPKAVPGFLANHLNAAYDQFLANLPANQFAHVDENGWVLHSDAADKLDQASAEQLDALKTWLSGHLRHIKLPELLIEVDNEIHFTRHFLPTHQRHSPSATTICETIATIMAYGCNIGPSTMARLTDDVAYHRIRQIADWQLTSENRQHALADLVNAISHLDVTHHWGDGTTSSSDGQRFRYKQKVLQQTWSPRFQDYALEFYSFIADNYAPFYSMPIECTDRDAAFVLDGLLYNESDLSLEEHYTDTHGYTDLNFAAFAMFGRRFAPRIRGLHRQRIFRIDDHRDYGMLSPLIAPTNRRIHLDWIVSQWDRMGHFYASLERGHTTASTALKRLAGYTGKNRFYRANRELGRIYKTIHILRILSDPVARHKQRRGLLKTEEMHALARQVAYGKQGTITARDIHAQQLTSNCLTLIMASIIYWQAREIDRVIQKYGPTTDGINWSMLQHTSPIGWDNITLYGQYILNRDLVKI
jgi:TnpA family transposase